MSDPPQGTVHCVVEYPRTFVQAICGEYMNADTYWANPSKFMMQFSWAQYCPDCMAHPDLELHLLGDVG